MVIWVRLYRPTNRMSRNKNMLRVNKGVRSFVRPTDHVGSRTGSLSKAFGEIIRQRRREYDKTILSMIDGER